MDESDFRISVNTAHGDAWDLQRAPYNLVTTSPGENILITLLEWKKYITAPRCSPSSPLLPQIMTFRWEQMKWANFQTHYKLSTEKDWGAKKKKMEETEGWREYETDGKHRLCISVIVFVYVLPCLGLQVCVCGCCVCFLSASPCVCVWCVMYALSVPFFFFLMCVCAVHQLSPKPSWQTASLWGAP